jgi:hypothetical protein
LSISCSSCSSDALSRATDLGFDVQASAAAPIVHHVGVGIEDCRDLVAELFGNFRNREPSLRD